MPIGSGIFNQLLLTGSPDPRQLPFGPGNRPYPTSYAATIRRRGRYTGSRFPVRLSTVGVGFWVLLRPLGRFSLPHGRPTSGVDPPDPNGVVMLRMNKIRSGRAPPYRGRSVRSRPTTTLRPAPAAFQRPVPTAPLTHPIGGGHLHEASSGVHLASPITPRWLAATPEPESETASRRSSPRPRPPDGTAAAFARPGLAPRGHPQSTPRRRQALRALARVLHLRHQPNLQPVPPTSPCTLMSHVVRRRFHHHPLDPQLDQPVGQPDQRPMCSTRCGCARSPNARCYDPASCRQLRFAGCGI